MTDPTDRAAAPRESRDEGGAWRRAGELRISAQPRAGDAVVLRLDGALDMASCDAVLEEVTALRASGPVIHLDLAGVDFMDSNGLRLLLGLTDGAAPKGTELRLVRPSQAVLRVAEVTRMTERLRL